MESEELHIKYTANSIYTRFKILEKYKTDLFSHLRDVIRILDLALEEPWKFDYPEHLDEFRKLRTFIIEESVNETKFTKDLADLTCNLNKTIEIFKRL